MAERAGQRGRVLIFDSHPVQYKAPVYRAAARLAPDTFEVIYATDVSARGYRDEGFGRELAWDTPLLEGYPYSVLGNERGKPLTSRRSLTGRGVWRLLRKRRPRAVLLTQFRYEFDFAAYGAALLLGIPIWIRQETQDEMFAATRSWWKAALRAFTYRVLYFPVRRAFCFGQLNREHLERHGFASAAIRTAHFSVADILAGENRANLEARRQAKRRELGIAPEKTLVAFFGKLIPKKNPDLLLEALADEAPKWKEQLEVLYVGAGEMEGELRTAAAALVAKGGPRTQFTGFINQLELPNFYLAADIVVLPSRRMGEAWGLVVNEALQAGAGVVMTDAVGCHREFGDWERVRVIREGDAAGLATALEDLRRFPRSFEWASEPMKAYSTEAAAAALAREFAA